jgi:hypothetical protein
MDLLHLKDVSWKGAFSPKNPVAAYFEEIVPQPQDEPEIIEEPIFVVHTLHSCYAHALIDHIVPYFSVKPSSFRLFIRAGAIRSFEYNPPMIGDITYKGAWKNLIEILSPLAPIFEHRLDPNRHYLFKDCYFYPLNDNYQRSIWNCEEYYPGRTTLLKDVLYSDSILYENLDAVRRRVLGPRLGTKGTKLLLIERKSDRRWDPKISAELQYYCSTSGWDYDEPTILEEMPFEDQVTLFSTARVVIFRHGSCLTNLLWVPEGTVVFDIDVQRDRKNIVGRLCALTGSTHHYLDYNKFDVERDIFALKPQASS